LGLPALQFWDPLRREKGSACKKNKEGYRVSHYPSDEWTLPQKPEGYAI
jgi:hypothetical protein